MSVKVLKDEIIYNLDLYAKVYPNREQSILCLADVQGDYDSLYFDSDKELNLAFKFIKSAFKEKQTEETIIDLDDLHETLSKEIKPDKVNLKKMLRDLERSGEINIDNIRYNPPEHFEEAEQDTPEEENEWPAEQPQPWPDPWPHLDEDEELGNAPEEHEEAMEEEEEVLPDEEVMADPFNNPDVGQPLGNLAEQFGFAGEQILAVDADHQNHIVGLEDQIREEITNQLGQDLDRFLAGSLTLQEIQDLEARNAAEDRRRDNYLDELRVRNQMLEQQVNELRNIIYTRLANEQNN